jgi:hypothetical protein
MKPTGGLRKRIQELEVKEALKGGKALGLNDMMSSSRCGDALKTW